jgi:hypothetical protein
VDAVVDERVRQAMVVAEREEEQLEVGAGAPDRGKVRDAVPGELGLAQSAAEEPGLDRPADVLDRPRGSGDRDAMAAGDVERFEVPWAVNRDPLAQLASGPSPDRDVDRPGPGAEEAPKLYG